MHKRADLAAIARQEAMRNFHGNLPGQPLNIQPLVVPFPPMDIDKWDGLWCAAFVHYCCNKAGFRIPARPAEARSCTLGGCIAWEEWAMADPRVIYVSGRDESFTPEPGDIVLFDRVFEDHPHDHIGIVLEYSDDELITAEGNVANVSAIVHRKRDHHIRSYLRLSDGFTY